MFVTEVAFWVGRHELNIEYNIQSDILNLNIYVGIHSIINNYFVSSKKRDNII